MISSEVQINVPFNNKDRRDTHSKSNNFAHAIKYFAKHTKDFNNLIFTGEMEKLIGLYLKNHYRIANELRHSSDNSIYITKIEDEVESQMSQSYSWDNSNSLNENSSKEKEKQTEYFDIVNTTNSIYLKDIKDNIKYIMDLKILIENKDKAIENNKKLTMDSYPKRSIYFRPEFLYRYCKEILAYEINEKDADGEKNTFIYYLRRYLFIENDNHSLNTQAVYSMTKWFKDTHIFLFINCLDSLYFKPYDSETLSEAFHSYGINIFFLGQVCEMTSVPHIRELCLIDMIARICKKIIFDLLACKIMERANEDFYLGINDHPKATYEFDPANQHEHYLPYVPVSFYL
jgi:hypothetical protein